MSVFSIINLSKGIVSFPFTSTNIIANNFNILNTYYDPTSSIDLDENVSHGLNFIKHKKSLENWIKKINFQ